VELLAFVGLCSMKTTSQLGTYLASQSATWPTGQSVSQPVSWSVR